MSLPVSFTLQSAAAQTAPFTLGHAFKKGDVPAGQSVVCSGANTFQVDARNVWPDGSLRFAMLSGTATLAAGVASTLTLTLGTPATGTALTTADLKATGITASVGAGAFGTVSWSGTDWDSPQQVWATGPVMSSWVYRKPVGSDPHLVAWLEVRLYASGAVDVLPWIENGYVMVADPTNKSETYTFTLGGTQRFSLAIDLKHHQRTVLINGSVLSYWLATDPGVTPTHNRAYLQSTELVPSYSGVNLSNNPFVAILPAAYKPYDSLDSTTKGSFLYNDGFASMAASGYQPAIGLLPEHDVLYLTYSTSSLFAQVVRNGYYAGQFGIHYRDETTQRPPLFSAYPTLVLNSSAGLKDSGSSSTGTRTPVPSGGSGPLWDTAHCPSVGFMSYLLTGRLYFMEETQFCITAVHLNVEDRARAGQFWIGSGYTAVQSTMYSGASSIATTELQTRAGAWHFRALAQALCVTPDNDTALLTEYKTAVEHNAAWHHAVYSQTPSNPYGFVFNSWLDYDYGSSDGLPTWQQDFFTAVWGYAQAMDLPLTTIAKTQMAAFFQWKARSVVGRTGTSSDWWYVNPAPYYIASAATLTPNYFPFRGTTGPWHASWKAMYDVTYAVLPSWASSTEGVLASEFFPESQPSQFQNMLPALAYAVRFNVPGALAGYNRITGASNFSAIAGQQNSRSVWSVTPSVIPSASNIVTNMGKTFSVSNSALIANRFVVGSGGLGTLGAVIQTTTGTGQHGPGVLHNDYDTGDDNKQFRAEIISWPSAGTLFMGEDGTFQFSGAPNGTYGFVYRLWVDGQDLGTVSVTLNVGAGVVTFSVSVAGISSTAALGTPSVSFDAPFMVTFSSISPAAAVGTPSASFTIPAPPVTNTARIALTHTGQVVILIP